jgi:hypothetical protein
MSMVRFDSRIPLPAGFSDADFASQSQNWLTERLAYLPQVRLVFGEKLPRPDGVGGIFSAAKALRRCAVNDD